MPPDLLGPLGVTVALGLATGALWRLHLQADERDRARSDKLEATIDRQQATIDRQSEVWDRLADRIEDVLDLVRPK